MRYRTTILFLLSVLLAAYPALKPTQQQALCISSSATEDSGGLLSLLASDGPIGCNSKSSQIDRTLLILAGFCALGGCLSAAKGWRDRQRDDALFNGARLPAWDRRVPYR